MSERPYPELEEIDAYGRDDLLTWATTYEIPGRSSMNVDELRAAITARVSELRAEQAMALTPGKNPIMDRLDAIENRLLALESKVGALQASLTARTLPMA
jgi:hypothetical protein